MTPISFPADSLAQEELSAATLTAIVRELVQREDELTAELAELRASLLPAAGAPPVAKAPATQGGIADKYANYQQLIARVRQVVSQAVPPGATIAVVSKGDNALLKLDGLNAWHFPQRDDGVYAGHHPADSAAAIAQLDRLKQKGADFLLIPQTAFWWLDHYREFRAYLDAKTKLVVRQEDTCAIFALRESSGAPPTKTASSSAPQRGSGQLCDFLRLLLPPDARVLIISKGDPTLLETEGLDSAHFPQDATGGYAGYYPADSAEAIAQLEALRRRGAEFLVVPRESAWWLDFYRDFSSHLQQRCRLVTRQENLCTVFDLR